MGNGGSVIQQELNKPLDCADLKSDADARAEVIRLRKLLKQNHDVLAKISETGGGAVSAGSGGAGASRDPATKSGMSMGTVAKVKKIKSPTNVDFSRFEKQGKNFKIENAPTLKDYLVNEFHRFCGTDEVLEWDEFWRFMKDLELGVSDLEIAQMRQKADMNKDGVVDWHELIEVIEPLLGKIWAAKLAAAEEWEKWCELHWETHHKVKKDKDGFTKKGDPFWVNKITGETDWTMPEILRRHSSLEKERAERNMTAAPSLEQFLTQAFEKNSVDGKPLSFAQLWKLVKDDLAVEPAITQKEMEALMESSDFNGDGKMDLNEFIHAMSPKFASMFEKREAGGDWITLTHVHEDGHEYLYWYNRVTHASSWENPKKPQKAGGKNKK